MRNNVVKALLKKEFLNIIRDRKSFIFMILLPLLMFPLLVGLMSFILTSFTKIDPTITIGVNYDVSDDFKNYVDSLNSTYEIVFNKGSNEQLKENFDDGKINLYVIKEGNTYSLHYDQNDNTSFANSSIIENIYYDYQTKYVENKLKEKGIDYESIKDEFKVETVQESVTEMGSFVPTIISMALISVITSVCFSLSIEVTTSEKEKGTLETLLSLPIKKSELITSKLLVVFGMSSLSGILAYISLFGTLFFAKDILKLLGVTSIIIDFKILIIFLIAILLLSLLLSGLLLSISVFCKTLKEAQNTLFPLELLATFISMLPMLGIKASIKYSLIPFVNIALLFNTTLSSNIDIMFVILSLLSTLCYSIILINIVSRVYNEEDVLFNTKSMNYLIFEKGKSKTICFSPLTSIIISVIIYLLAMYFSLMFITSSQYLLLAIMPLTILFVIFISSILVKLDIKKSFKINKFSLKKLYIFFLLYVGTYILSTTLVDVVSRIFPKIVTDYSQYESMLNVDNIFMAIFLIALLPAVAEELLFRGVIFNSFNKRYKVSIAIFISALLFGVYHMNWIQGIFAFFMGLTLAYGYYKTGSIFPSIIIHFINNAFSVISDKLGILDFNMPLVTQICIIFLAIILVGSSLYIFEKELDN